MSTIPPCNGQSVIFDSTDVRDHAIARAICATCPMLAACRKRLEDVKADSLADYGPRGTWAGELFGRPQTARHRAQAEEAMFTEAEAREAHARHEAGFRDARTVTGERVYNRRKKRAQYARRTAA